MSFNIVQLSSVHTPLDSRIFYKECQTLIESGYCVTYVVPGKGNVVEDGVKFDYLKLPHGRFQRVIQTVFSALTKAISLKADLYHFHDPELIPVGFVLKLLGKKVVYDVHENLPDQLLEKHWLGPRFIRKGVAAVMRGVEWLAGCAFDGIIGVTPEIISRFPRNKSVLLRNFVRCKMVDAINSDQEINDRCVAIYPGSISRSRGIMEIIEAVGSLKGEVDLLICGSWKDNKLLEECRASKGWKYTRYMGRLKQEQVFKLIKSSNIGLHLVYPVANNSGAYPTKAFEFMACGIPFIVTDQPAKRNTFGEIAVYADARDPKDIAQKLKTLARDEKLRKKLGRAGRTAIENEFSWEKESKKMLELYTNILTKSH